MTPVQLSEQQRALVDLPADRRIFVEGIAGTGKTTAAVARLERLLRAGVPARRHPAGAAPAHPRRALRSPAPQGEHACGRGGHVVTVGGLGQRMIELYWPLVAARPGFAQPDRPPVFLTLETAQYFMARVVRPMLEARRVRLDPRRPQPPVQPDHRQPEQGGGRRVRRGRARAPAQGGVAGRVGAAAGVRRRAGGGEPVPRSTACSTTCSTSRSSTSCSPGACGRCRRAASTSSRATATSSSTTPRKTRRPATTSWPSGCPRRRRRWCFTTWAAATAGSWARTRRAATG